jgi:prepilin-type N-terminal cleavage/methylation domain-containing protein
VRRAPLTPLPRAGFSFIEVMIALTLLATVIGSLGILSARVSSRARLAQVIAQRNYIVVQQMNRYNALPYDSLVTYAQHGNLDTIPSAMSGLRFLRRDSVYVPTATGTDTLRLEARVVVVPLDGVKSDTMLKDSILLRRRNPRLTSPLNK